MSTISKVALYFPEKTFTNEAFFEIFPEEKESKTWSKLGISQRHIIGKSEVPSDMGLKAAEKLLNEYPHLRNEIDFLIFNGHERDHYTPVTASVLQAKLGLSERMGCIDVHQGCASFIHLVAHADGLINIGAAKKVLVVTLSSLTRQFDPKDAANRYMFGDAATAFVVEHSSTANFESYCFGNDATINDNIILLDGESRNPINDKSFEPIVNRFGHHQIPGYFYQNGSGVFRFILDRVPQSIDETLEKSNLTRDDIDFYLFHQPNAMVLKTLSKIAKLDEDKLIIDLERHGNTVSVSIPILIHNLLKENKIKPNMNLLICGFGTGMSWNTCIWKT